MWVCPHCGLGLQASPDGAALACARGHSFDRAREGYVNLLPANRKRSAEPGDSPEMVAARRRVHEAAAYQPLAEAIVGVLAGLPVGATVLDLGCGEGYYGTAVARALPGRDLYGIDISRPAVRLAAKRLQSASFAVANAYQLPLPPGSFDAIIRVFAPSSDPEVTRVLRPGGVYLEVCPAQRHLWQVRAALYDTPRGHEPPRTEIAGLQLLRQLGIEYELATEPALLADIIGMTPFAHRGRREGRQRLADAAPAAVTMAFSLQLYRLDC
jgi:23S rRNA (guanine745-N1)-methyltransferase